MDSWLAQYVEVLEGLNGDNLYTLSNLTSDKVSFRDPFNDIHTQKDFIAIMDDMFQRLTYVHFEVHRTLQQEQEAFIYWSFYGNSRITGEFTFDGVSRIEADEQGKVTLHHDFWDASELMQKIPLLGGIIGKIRCKLNHNA